MLATDSAGNDNTTRWEEVARVLGVIRFVSLLQCNNPRTKEPKLTAAARIVPEWVEYDNEIKQLLRRVQGQEDTPVPKHTPSASQHEKGLK